MIYPQLNALNEFYEALYALPPRASRDVVTPREVTARLLAQLGHPERKVRSVLITGSKGKGSVALMLSSALQVNGRQVGLFTSPHLFDYRERIQINSQMISEYHLLTLANRVFNAASQLSVEHEDEWPRFFEITTAIAYLYFAEEGVDIAVMETGIGAKTDAVNQACHDLAILTHIEAEHLDIFGDMPTLIDEKCGVMRAHTPLVTGACQADVTTVVDEKARALDVPVHLVSKQAITYEDGGYIATVSGIPIACDSVIKAQNIAIAATAYRQLGFQLGFDLNASVARQFAQMQLPARQEIVATAPLIIIDSAHTQQSAEHLLEFVQNKRQQLGLTGKLVALLSFSAEKNIHAVIEGLDTPMKAPINTPMNTPITLVVTQADSFRAIDSEQVAAVLKAKGLTNIQMNKHPENALTEIMSQLTPSDTLIVTGSVYLAGWASHYFNAKSSEFVGSDSVSS